MTNEERTALFGKYKVKLVRNIPNNRVLMVRNRVTSKITIKTSGMHMVMPWCESREVRIDEQILNYPVRSYETIEGFEVDVDLGVQVKIVDPEKAYYSHNDVFESLRLRFESILVHIFKAATYEEISNMNFDINLLANDYRLSLLHNELQAIENQHGIKVVNIIKASVNQSGEMNEAYASVKKAEKEKEAEARRAEAQLFKDLKEAEGQKAKNDVELEKFEKKIGIIAKELKGNGVSKEDISKIIQTVLYTDSNANTNINIFDSGNSNAIQMGAAIGAGINSNSQSDKLKRNKYNVKSINGKR